MHQKKLQYFLPKITYFHIYPANLQRSGIYREEAPNDLCRSRRKVLKFGWAINNTKSFNGTGSAFILAKI